jgi:hypothetical protein
VSPTLTLHIPLLNCCLPTYVSWAYDTPAWQLPSVAIRQPTIDPLHPLLVHYHRRHGHKETRQADRLHLHPTRCQPAALPCHPNRQQQDPRQHEQRILAESWHLARLRPH